MSIHAIIVLGDKPVNGEIVEAYKDRIDRALEFVKQGEEGNTLIVLTGGETVAGEQAESVVAARYLPKRLSNFKLPVTYLLETTSKTTPENILYAQDELICQGKFPRRVTIIGRRSQMAKVKIVVRQLWIVSRVEDVEYVGGLDTTPWWYQLFDTTVMCVVTWLDPTGRWTLAPVRKLLRNE